MAVEFDKAIACWFLLYFVADELYRDDLGNALEDGPQKALVHPGLDVSDPEYLSFGVDDMSRLVVLLIVVSVMIVRHLFNYL